MPYTMVNGHKLYYAESRGPDRCPPLFWVHGAGGDHTHWPPQLRRLPGLTVYAPDLPGHGRSEGPGRRAIPDYAADVLALLDALDVERVILGGHSMGGAIAQTLALDSPKRVAGLILVGTGAKLRVTPQILDRLPDEFEAVIDTIIEMAYGPGASDELISLGRRTLAACDPHVLEGDFRACDAFDVMARLEAIRAPTLVIGGTSDQLTPPKYVRYLAEHIPNAQLHLIEDAGHMLALEAPQQVADVVEAWVGKLRVAS
jgi:pimeloyl-ACP methyl ester carboxylesterase